MLLYVFLTIDHCHIVLGPKDYSVLKDHHVSTDIGKLSFKYFPPHNWNNLQKLVKLDELISFNQFKLKAAVV